MPRHSHDCRFVTAATLGLILGLAGCVREPAARSGLGAGVSDEATPVTLAPVTDTAVVRPIIGTGVLGAKEEVPLGFKIGGVIARIPVDEGDEVRAGQLLAELEQPEIGAEVSKAEAGEAQAERDFARATALYRDSVIARDRFEAAGTGLEVARANLRIARFNERYAAIRAPASGTILRRLAEPGQQIGNGTAVLVLGAATRGSVVRVGLADRDMARIRLGDAAQVWFEAGSEGAVPARVARIAAAASPGTGVWLVELTLESRGRGISSGLIGRVEIRPRAATSTRVVPIAALVEGDGDSAIVYSVAAGKAERHHVRIAFLDGERAAIASGLDGVTQVVTAGAGYLSEGARVVP